MDFLTFVPIYLTQTLKLQPGVAGQATTAFPLGMFVAVLGAGFLYDRLSRQQRVWVVGGLLASGLLSIGVMLTLLGADVPPKQAATLCLIAVFWFGVAVAPAYYLPMSVFAISFGGPFCGFLICLFDMFGYAGAFMFTYAGGTIIKQHGWQAFLLFLGAITMVSTALMVSFLYLDNKALRVREYSERR
jgi:MFS family permease